MVNWRPSAARRHLVARAEMLREIREHFQAYPALEVETPTLGLCGVTDPHIENIEAIGKDRQHPWFLQTSPEYAMKRLLAAEVGDCFQICRAYRDREIGRVHQPEFTLLEWYRHDESLDKITNETLSIIQNCLPHQARVKRISYEALFESAVGINPFSASAPELTQRCRDAGLEGQLARDAQLEFLLDTFAIDKLPESQLTLITHYPLSQASLAKGCPNDPRVALRFEVFHGALELANGFVELTDPDEQAERFTADNLQRERAGMDVRAIDQAFLAALRAGLPECAGVALGLDRLLMARTGRTHINDVVAFAHEQDEHERSS